jgi:hypothetical protein
MTTINLNAYGVSQMNKQEMVEIDGGRQHPGKDFDINDLIGDPLRIPTLLEIIRGF